jgi:hypothetical protein
MLSMSPQSAELPMCNMYKYSGVVGQCNAIVLLMVELTAPITTMLVSYNRIPQIVTSYSAYASSYR